MNDQLVRMRIDVLTSEHTVQRVMKRLRCGRKKALFEIRDAWIGETENMHPVWYDDEDTIQFETGGA